MKLNRTELKKILYDFNSLSNRLQQADYRDYSRILDKYISFLHHQELINTYLRSCGEASIDVEEEFKSIKESFGQYLPDFGSTEAEEVSNIIAFLEYLIKNSIFLGDYFLHISCDGSNSYQDIVKGFNKRVVNILIDDIENYLTKVGIDMGLDETIKYDISTKNGQVIIASDNAQVSATNIHDKAELSRLDQLLSDLKSQSDNLNLENQIKVKEHIDVLQQGINSKNKSMINVAINGLKQISKVTGFIDAVNKLWLVVK